MKVSNNKSKVLIIIISIILVIFLFNFFQKRIKNFFYSFSAPIQRVLWGAGDSTADFLSAVFRSGELKGEVNKLKAEKNDIVSQIINYQELKEENEVLRNALDIGLKNEFKISFAQIIEKDISQDFILINKGAKDGLLKNMPVITEEKVLIGKINEVYNKFSKVMLISNKESSFDAKEINSLVGGIIRGTGSSNLLFDLIPKDEIISSGDIIVTDCISGIFPAGLFIGTVINISKSDVGSFQQAEIKPAFVLSETKNLFVITEF